MPKNKPIRCTVCGELIRTMVGALSVGQAPVVCRRCFGHQTYSAPVTRSANIINVPDQGAEA
jgi:hypothetical protein